MKILGVISLLLFLTASSRPESLQFEDAEDDNSKVECDKCRDKNGKSCEEVLKQFGKTKYWILKGGGKEEFSNVESTCTSNGRVVAKIDSESEVNEFSQLAASAGYDSYWATSGDGQHLVFQKDGTNEASDSGEHAGVCMWPDGHPCVSSKKEPTIVKPGPTPDKSCPQPKIAGSNRLIRTGPNSKYLYPEEKTYNTWEQCKQICESAGLQIASVITIKDFLHLRDDWIKKSKLDEPKTKTFLASIGLTPEGTDGGFKDVNSGNPAALELFNVFLRLKTQEGCAALMAFNGMYTFEMAPCNNQNMMPLCQYPADSDCYKKSPLSIYEEEEADELIVIGSTGKRVFHGSRKQKTWKDASSFCETNEMKLLDFIKNDVVETSMIWGLVDKYQHIINFPYQIVKSWTSGMFKDGFEVGRDFVFESNGETWSWDDGRKHFRWIEEIQEPENERCVVVAGTQKLRPVICNLANFFLCYKWEPGFEPTTTTTPETPSNATADADDENENKTADPKCKGDPTVLSFSDDGMTTEEVLGLISLSENLNFSKGYSNVLKIKEESAWRIPHVKAMGSIAKHVCPDPFVEEEFVNVLMNLIMIYYHSLPERGQTPGSKRTWDNMRARYKSCKNISDPFPFILRGGMVIGVDVAENNGKSTGKAGEKLGKIVITSEVVDDGKFFALDIIMEGLWYMFEITAGSCYNIAKWKTTWLAEFFYNFRNDFTEPLKGWWISPAVQNYGLLFGDIDLVANLYNLRACAVATFQRIGIIDKLPVRPLLTNETFSWRNNLNKRTHLIL